jgi:ribosomal protein S18 acetylase RimI-like enzyme
VQIQNSNIHDIDAIYDLYSEAINYQRLKGYNLWPEFDRGMIEKEILENRNWKIMDGEHMACVFSVLYSDPIIWQEKNNDPAVYLHRITTHPDYKGREMIKLVKDWAITHARSLGKKYVRMDTWGDNTNMRDYYIKHGFKYLGQAHLDEISAKKHYGGRELSLLQIEV